MIFPPSSKLRASLSSFHERMAFASPRSMRASMSLKIGRPGSLALRLSVNVSTITKPSCRAIEFNSESWASMERNCLSSSSVDLRVYEVFQHGHSLADFINDCDIKMKRQKHFTIPKALLKKLRGNSSSERLLHRLHAVALVAGGLSASEVGQIYGDSPRAVAYWVTQYRKSGFEGLQEEDRPGRPCGIKPNADEEAANFCGTISCEITNGECEHPLQVYQRRVRHFSDIPQCWRILNRLK